MGNCAQGASIAKDEDLTESAKAEMLFAENAAPRIHSSYRPLGNPNENHVTQMVLVNKMFSYAQDDLAIAGTNLSIQGKKKARGAVSNSGLRDQGVIMNIDTGQPLAVCISFWGKSPHAIRYTHCNQTTLNNHRRIDSTMIRPYTTLLQLNTII